MPVRRPRIEHISASDVVSNSCPSSVIWPLVTARSGSNCITDRAVIDLPDPLSPVTATISPGATSSETFFRIS